MTDWFTTSLGAHLLECERTRVQQLLPSGYYPRSLQVGRRTVNFLHGVECDERFLIDEHLPDGAPSKMHTVIARASAMPFTDKTHNLIVLPHTLDFCPDPHAVLREINQILLPQGCVVVTGFNRLSLWGAMGLVMKTVSRTRRSASSSSPSPSSIPSHSPWQARNRRVGQVQDWLSLLGFDLVGAAMLGYQPPLQSENWRRKLEFIDRIGARWLPALGAVYVIVGRKREIAISNNRTARPAWRQLLPTGIVQPAARVPLKIVRSK